jgi:hypothetical protein
MKNSVKLGTYTALAAAVLVAITACGSGSGSGSGSGDAGVAIAEDYPLLEGQSHHTRIEEIAEDENLTVDERRLMIKAFESSSTTDVSQIASTTDVSQIDASASVENAVLDPTFSPLLSPEEKFFTVDSATQTTVTRNDINEIYANVIDSGNRWADSYTLNLLYQANERSFPVISDGRGGHLVMAGRFGLGRTAVVTHDSFLSTKTTADSKIFENLLTWLTFNNPNGYSERKAGGQKMRILARSDASNLDEIPNSSVDRVNKFGVIDVNVYPLVLVTESVTDDEIENIQKYVANGGAIIFARTTWNIRLDGEFAAAYGNDLKAYPMMRWLKKAGYGLSGDWAWKGVTEGEFPVLRTLTKAHVTAAYPVEAAENVSKLLKGSSLPPNVLEGYAGKDTNEKIDSIYHVGSMLTKTNPGNKVLATNWNIVDNRFAMELASKGKVDCDAIDLSQICTFMRSYLSKLTPAPTALTATLTNKSAGIFPGLAIGNKVNARVVVDSAKGTGYSVPGTWVSTDRWANAGEVINIVIPTSETSPDLEVIIGATTDYLPKANNAERYLYRLPKASWKVKLFPGSNKIVTPAGGQIFLSATSKKENKNLTVDIEGAIPSLRFKLGETDPAAFKNSADKNKVPYFEIEGEFVRLFVPSNHLAKFAAKPVDVTSSWNNKRQASNIFLGLTDKTDTPTVHSPSPVKTAIVVDKQISVGHYHSGYPIGFPIEVGKDVASKGTTGWADAHEWGHNLQGTHNLDVIHPITGNFSPLYPLNFAPNGEVTNNLLPLWDEYTRNVPLRLDIEKEGYTAAWKFVNTPGNDFSKTSHWDALVFYHQYNLRYGWDFYSKFFRKYRDHAFGTKVDQAIGDFQVKIRPDQSPSRQDHIDAFALFASRTSGFNQIGNLRAWGMSISSNVEAKILSWNYPIDDKITYVRGDCLEMQKKSPDLQCYQPGDASLAAPVYERPVKSSCVAWIPGGVYQAGAKVIYGGKNWTAKWWTQRQEPGKFGSPWTETTSGC